MRDIQYVSTLYPLKNVCVVFQKGQQLRQETDRGHCRPAPVVAHLQKVAKQFALIVSLNEHKIC